MKKISVCLLFFCVLVLSDSFVWGEEKNIAGDLIIFHAGSLSTPFKQIADSFKKEYPKVNILREPAGSRSCARKISDIKKPCDVFASADYSVIDNLLIPEFASWNIKFTRNEISIVYTDKSAKKEEINKDNWVDILLSEDVAFGRSNPNTDPCGYRSVLTMKLAEEYYHCKGLAEKMMVKDTRYIRPKETDLLALLEIGEIDYIFLYKSVAVQHGLNILTLPEEINLNSLEFSDQYNKATLEISGKTPNSFLTKKGEPIVYGVTIPKSSPNPLAALAFVEFLLTRDKGQKIMEENGQSSVVPAYSESYIEIPSSLKKFAKPLN